MMIALIVAVTGLAVTIFALCELRAYHGAALMRWSQEHRMRQLENHNRLRLSRQHSQRRNDEYNWLRQHTRQLRSQWRIRWVVNALVILALLTVGGALIVLQLNGIYLP